VAKPPGVFLLEGAWSSKLTATDTMLPLLTYLRDSQVISSVAHRYVDTKEGLIDAAKKWGQKQYEHLSLGYFGFHGDPGTVWLGRTQVGLEELADVLAKRCRNRVIYFGSCAVLAGKAQAAEYFLKTTGARAVIGYTKRVDWMESSAFDLLLFDALTRYQRLRSAENWLTKTYPDITGRLGLRVLHRAPAKASA
jgi:hypothetical protein